MDLNVLRSVVTIVAFAMFLGIVWWALSRRRGAEFEEAARLPFDGPADTDRTPS
jgi:cytochrome c oxidase cbb3-type subunit IV